MLSALQYSTAIGCANPPQPNTSLTHLKMEGNFMPDFVYDVGDIVSYVCESANYQFAHNISLPRISMECLPTGDWEDILPWKICNRPEGKSHFGSQLSSTTGLRIPSFNTKQA